MRRRLFVPLLVAALLLAFGTIVTACGDDGGGEATATAEAERLLEATATAEALAEEIAPSLTATAEVREAAEKEAAIATAEAEVVAATATAVASIGLTRDDPLPFGQTKIVPKGWEIIVVDFNPDATQLVLAENPFNDPPAAGFKYVMVRVRGTNISAGEPADFVATLPFRLVGSRSVLYDPFSPSCGVYPENLLIDVPTEVFSGASVEGNVCFQVGADETGLVMSVSFSFDLEEDRTFFALE